MAQTFLSVPREELMHSSSGWPRESLLVPVESARTERAGKPGFVGGDHFSRTAITRRLQQPTRESNGSSRSGAAEAAVPPAWSCSRRGLPCQSGHPDRGALLPHLFTLTARSRCRGRAAVCFLWHCPGPRGRWVLPTTVPCGARTFLSATHLRTSPSDRLAHSVRSYCRSCGAPWKAFRNLVRRVFESVMS